MKHLIINEITQAHIEQLESAAEALAAVVLQFGAPTTFRSRPARTPLWIMCFESSFPGTLQLRMQNKQQRNH